MLALRQLCQGSLDKVSKLAFRLMTVPGIVF
jgi:hypothetical protein